MPAPIDRKRRPQPRLRRVCVPTVLPVRGPPGRPDFDDEGVELIGPGTERSDGQ
jgi:hypothetical protein